jgi:cobalamin biosynthesis protein CbiG
VTTLAIGIGCRAGAPADALEAAVRAALGALGALGALAFADVAVVASVDTKAHERGLLDFCARHGLRLELFSRANIAAMPVTQRSAAACAHLGVHGVCEPCALLAAAALVTEPASRHVRLVAHKTVHGGVTVAIASVAGAKPITGPQSAEPTQQDFQ